MAVSDPVADFLTRIRNGAKAQHRFVDVNWSRMKESMASILKQEGFIENYLIQKDTAQRGTIRMFLKYAEGRHPVIKGLQRVSKPGCRRYVGQGGIPKFYGGLGVSILSTSKGVITGRAALEKGIGGELLCLVW